MFLLCVLVNEPGRPCEAPAVCRLSPTRNTAITHLGDLWLDQVLRCQHGRVCIGWEDEGHQDMARGQLLRQRLKQAPQRKLGGGVGRVAIQARLPCLAGHEDDAPPSGGCPLAGLCHEWQSVEDGITRAHHVDAKGVLKVSRCRLLEAFGARHASRVHQNINAAAVRRRGAVHCQARLRLVANVGDVRRDALRRRCAQGGQLLRGICAGRAKTMVRVTVCAGGGEGLRTSERAEGLS